jgi:hypothetical protein
MGARGPIPKPSAARRRRNKDSETTKVGAASEGGGGGAPMEVAQLIAGRAREVIERVKAAASVEVLRGAAKAERRVTVLRAIEVRVAELEASRFPQLPEGVHSIARRWYESLQRSAQVELYEPSDWAAAVFVAEAMTRLLRAEKLSAVGFAAVWSAMGELLTTEGARRRARVEIERGKPAETPKGVTKLQEYRERLGGKQ